MAFYQKKNNAKSKIATVGGIDGSTNPVTFAVTTGEGARFPSANFLITIDSEILLCTSRTGDSFTCTRAQEGTTIAAHSQNADVESRITVAQLVEYETAIDANKVLFDNAVSPTVNAYGLMNNSLYRQALINGNFDVWQRGTSASNVSNYATADRWQTYRAGLAAGMSVSQQDGSGVTGSRYCLRVQRAAGNATTEDMVLAYNIETADSVKFVGKKVTLSFWARKGANYSAASDVLLAKIKTGTGVDGSERGGITGSVDLKTLSATLTTSWQKFTVTTDAVLAATVNQIVLKITETPVGTAGAADYFEITQVQLCAGDVALPFMPKSFEEELRACKRYYEKSWAYVTAPGTNTETDMVEFTGAGGACTIGDYVFYRLRYQVEKAKAVTPTIYDTTGTSAKLSLKNANSTYTSGVTAACDQTTTIHARVYAATTATTQRGMAFHYVCDAEL